MNDLKKFTTTEEQISKLEKEYMLKMDEDGKEKLKLYLEWYGYERVVTDSKPLLFDNANSVFKEEYNAKDLCKIYDLDRNISTTISRYLLKSAEIKFNTLVANHIAKKMYEKGLEKHGLIGTIVTDDLEKIFPKYEIEYPKYKNRPQISQLKRDLLGLLIIQENRGQLLDEYKNIIAAKHAEISARIESYSNNKVLDKEIMENVYLPIWTLATSWTFDRTVKFYNCLDEQTQKEIIKKFVGDSTNWLINNSLSQIHKHVFPVIMNWMKYVRNIVAHNGQIYSLEYNPSEKNKQLEKHNIDFNFVFDFLKNVFKITRNENDSYGLMSFVKILESVLSIHDKKIQKEINELFGKRNISEQVKKLLLEKIRF